MGTFCRTGVLLTLLACGPPDFTLHVTFPEPVDIDEGARVMYQGIAVGRVECIALRQEAPDEPALVEITLSISDPEVTIREADRIHLTAQGVPGTASVQIQPSPELSPPLEPGATVTGIPPLVTRVQQSLGAAIDALGELASEKAREVLERLADSLEELEEREGEAPPE